MTASIIIKALIVLVVCTSAATAKRNCSQLGTSDPCQCRPGKYGRRLICPKISSELNLNLVIRCTNRFHVSEFVLDDSELRYINHDTFQGTSYRRIHIKRTSLVSLTDRREAFTGLEDQLEELVVERGSFVSNWDWTNLNKMVKLHSIEVLDSDYEYVTGFEDVKLPGLTKLTLKGCSITGIADNAFASLTTLRELILSDNYIETVKRSMLPKPAEFLENINLSNNSIRTFPDGVFSDLPNLKMIFLRGNQMHTIDKKVFTPIWKQLKFIQFKDNPIICDCRMKWIANAQEKPDQIFAECQSPDDLKGTSLSTLKATDLWC